LRIRRVAVAVLKYGVVVAALSYLILTGRLDPRGLDLDPARLHIAAAAVLLVLLPCLLSFVRWWLLLRGAAAPIPFPTAVRLGFVGMFFNTFMFGAFGGDLVKIGYVIRETHRRGAAAASVLIDRICGLLGLLALGGLAIVLSWDYMQRVEGLPYVALTLFAVLAGFGLALAAAIVAVSIGRAWALAGVALLLLAQTWIVHRGLPSAQFGMLSVWAHAATTVDLSVAALTALVLPGLLPGRTLSRLAREHLPGGHALMGFVEGLLAYRRSPGSLAIALGLSIIIQGMVLLALTALAQATGFGVTMTQVFFSAPPALVVNALPVPMGGLGVGETAFAELLRTSTAGAIRNGAVLFLGWRIILNLIGVGAGLPLYLRGKRDIQAVRRTYAPEGLATDRQPADNAREREPEAGDTR